MELTHIAVIFTKSTNAGVIRFTDNTDGYRFTPEELTESESAADSADAVPFLQAYPPRFEIIYDPDGDLAREYDVNTMPSSYVIGRDGELVTRHLGFKVRRQEEYEAVLQESLQAD